MVRPPLVLSLVVLLAARAAAQIEGDYLPPPIPPAADVPCAPPVTEFITQTQVVSQTVTRHAFSTLYSSVTVSAHETRLIPSTVLATVVSTVPVQQDRTVYSERLRYNTETQTVRVPGVTRVLTSTDVVTQTQRHVELQTSLVLRTVTSTAFSTDTITATETVSTTYFYPSQVLRFVTETQKAAPVTVTHVELRQVRQFVTSQPPASTVYRTETNYFTQTETVEAPSPPITQTETVTIPTEIYVTSTFSQPDIRTQTETLTRFSTRLITRTEYSTQYRTAVQQETAYVPQTVESTRTSVFTREVTVTLSRTLVSTEQPPAVTQPVTITSVQPVTVTPPAVVQESTITSQIASTSVYITTALVTQYSTRLVEVTAPCEGYQYQAPANPLRF